MAKGMISNAAPAAHQMLTVKGRRDRLVENAIRCAPRSVSAKTKMIHRTCSDEQRDQEDDHGPRLLPRTACRRHRTIQLVKTIAG